MKPILFYLGTWPLHAYSLFLLLGMGAGFLALHQGWREAGLRPGAIYGFGAGVVLAGLVGGRLGYLLLHAGDATAPGPTLRLWQGGGEAAWGALIALLAWSWAYSRRAGVSTGDFFDLLAPPAALAEGVMRWGCLLNGCCYGRETTDLGLYLPNLDGQWAFRYPTQVLYSAVGLGLFALLWTGRKKKPFAGFLALLYLILYSASRLGIGFLRGDYATPMHQAVSLSLDLAILAVGVSWMAWRVRQLRKLNDRGSIR